MRTRVAVVAALPVLLLASQGIMAQVDKYQVTPEEHAACDPDAYKFCSDSADQDQLLACMKLHRSDLTAKCRSTFTAGLKRRHLPL